MWYHPAAAVLAPDGDSGFRAPGGGRSRGMLQPCAKRSTHVNILRPAVSPQRVSCDS